MLRLRVELGVRGLKAGNLLAQRRDGSLHRGPVIDEMRDWDALRELLQAADMIDVVVRGHQVVDLRHAGIGESRHDPVGVPATGAAGVHEHGLPARRHVERGLSAFGIDGVDLERLRFRGLTEEDDGAQDDSREQYCQALHSFLHSCDIGM